MNVEETKLLILRRLDEIRTQQRQEAHEPTDMPAPRQPRPKPKPKPKRRQWLRSERRERGSDGHLADRLESLEERLAALERCFVTSQMGSPQRPPAPGPMPVTPGAGQVPGAAGSQGPHAPTQAATPQAAPQPPNTAPGVATADNAEGGNGASASAGDVFGGEPYRLTGSVEDGLMTDVLQMLASNQKTGRFSLFLDESGDRFDLIFRDGEIIHGSAGELEGEAAFFSLMVTGHQEGRYGFLETDIGEITASIEAKTQFLILEALRRIDEERQQDG